MKRVSFKTVIQSKKLEKAFEPISQAVDDAYHSGDMGAVFCQVFRRGEGVYEIKGSFYPREQASNIYETLVKANKELEE